LVIKERRKTMPKYVRRYLSVPEQHQLKIARKTLSYSDEGAKIMGPPSKAEARAIIKRLTGRTPKD
jgi:hypothetical protein